MGLPVPKLQIVVSDQYQISKSLVPAWYGHAGRMEFPTWRVVARKAAIAHELAHVFFPNGNRFLAEGLAVFLQAEIGGNSAFPNFGRPLHELTRDRLREMVPEFTQGNPKSLARICLADLDKISTPVLLRRSGSDGISMARSRAGRRTSILLPVHSFNSSLKRAVTENFRALYTQTPLIQLEQRAGSPDRWSRVYGVSLVDLETEWKVLMTGRDERAGDEC